MEQSIHFTSFPIEVDCNEFRLENAVSLPVVNQSVSVACRSGFSYFPSTPLLCHLGTGVINIGMCAQTRWINQPHPFRTDLPAPLSRGAEISVRWAGKGENVSTINVFSDDNSNVFHFAMRWWKTVSLYNTKSSAGLWDTEIYASTFIFTPNVVYDVGVRITTSHDLIHLNAISLAAKRRTYLANANSVIKQIFIDGDSFLEAPIRKPVEDAVSLRVSASHLESVEVKYP